jgi:hypothetical protein
MGGLGYPVAQGIVRGARAGEARRGLREGELIEFCWIKY